MVVLQEILKLLHHAGAVGVHFFRMGTCGGLGKVLFVNGFVLVKGKSALSSLEMETFSLLVVPSWKRPTNNTQLRAIIK